MEHQLCNQKGMKPSFPFSQRMGDFASFIQKYKHKLCRCWSCIRLPFFIKATCFPLVCCYRYVILRMNQLSLELFYFLFVSTLGFLILMALKPRTDFQPRKLDLFFTSVSASTVSSMSTTEMEVFSNAQLIIMTLLMFIGGEVFTSVVGLHLRGYQLRKSWQTGTRVGSISSDSGSSSSSNIPDEIELGSVPISRRNTNISLSSIDEIELGNIPVTRRDANLSLDSIYHSMKIDSIKFLGFVVLGYLLLIQFLGVALVFGYMNLVLSAKNVLKNKGLKQFTFAIFTVVSTFASCGFIPTNENMIVFSKNSGLLLILIPQVLFGNTLVPPCLRFCIWFLGNFFKKLEAQYLLKNTEYIGYFHLLPSLHSSLLAASVLGFILVQFILFCALEWNSSSLNGLNTYHKIVGVLFQTTNARHSGESIVDLSTIAPAILVVFIVMMYLPPYTSFLQTKGEEENPQPPQEAQVRKEKRARLAENLIFSQLSYLAIFIILICITERTRMKDDPLNFNVLNITVEVISAYGNVGFTTGYGCGRMLKPDPNCQDKWYGFAGKWSDQGKLILIVVMFFGRLKKFNMDGGKAWKLL